MPLLFLLLACLAAAQEFKPHDIATGLRGGYQVVPYDMNNDGKPDLIALASGMPELVWYENPTWERHVIAGPFPRMINLAIDNPNQIALAYAFENVAAKSIGNLAILNLKDSKWTATEIDKIPTSHRLRWADLFGTGNKVLINSVLTNAKAEPPDYKGDTPLYYYDPRDWKRQSIPVQNQGVVHGIYITRWDNDKRDDVITASFSGIHVHMWNKQWKREEISNINTSDVAIGHIKKDRFIAAIEPWHGNTVSVYEGKQRTVIDSSLADGHTIVTADFDKDGVDEIIAGCRQGPKSVFLYKREKTGWTKRTLDAEMPAAACVALDLNGDKRIDIACIAAGNQTLRWYENTGPR